MNDNGMIVEWEEEFNTRIVTSATWDEFTYFAGGHGDIVSIGTQEIPVVEQEMSREGTDQLRHLPAKAARAWARQDAPPSSIDARGLWDRLMREVLGYATYIAQGGDVGGNVAVQLALNHAGSVAGIHLNGSPENGRPPAEEQQSPEERAWRKRLAAYQQTEQDYLELEEKSRLVRLLDEYISSAGLTVIIGSEHTTPDLRSFSVVAATYSDGRGTGTIGVIGPTRMRYSRAINAVDMMTRAISRVAGRSDY